MAREVTYNSFEISLVVLMPNITTNHAITYTNSIRWQVISKCSLWNCDITSVLVSNLKLKLSFFVDRKKKDNEYGVSRGVDFQGDMN